MALQACPGQRSGASFALIAFGVLLFGPLQAASLKDSVPGTAIYRDPQAPLEVRVEDLLSRMYCNDKPSARPGYLFAPVEPGAFTIMTGPNSVAPKTATLDIG